MSEEKQWTEVFHAIDKDKNGFLTREEIAQCLKEVGVCPNVADECYPCFANPRLYICIRSSLFIDDAEVFQSIDKDGSGKVSIKELDEFLKTSGMDIDQNSLRNWMTQNDKNKDGELDYDEFLAYVRQTYK
ncbi:similar to 16 kDa calcium-binding protein [Schistosoma mansoni]|uniref:similar to 16 kDa calcium-binding protein n=1 Tax=Schistosoma mansoni TaxID=6183 RepID=UPI00022DCB6A|nr:similar to 16 kDa calcium-binding protein [Schistosoma mansoni]|eukprot:XP_018654192.1 similar to 16 kDa calcium-binding protein [Schistosoma mansoni]